MKGEKTKRPKKKEKMKSNLDIKKKREEKRIEGSSIYGLGFVVVACWLV